MFYYILLYTFNSKINYINVVLYCVIVCMYVSIFKIIYIVYININNYKFTLVI